MPNQQKLETFRRVMATYPHLEREIDANAGAPRRAPHAPRRTRATIKVQDGCNVFCAFCSIPYTRKYMLSRPVDGVVAEVEAPRRAGLSRDRDHRRSGRRLRAGRFSRRFPGRNLPAPLPFTTPLQTTVTPDLADLLLRLAEVPGIERVRLSSIEPTQVTDRLLDAFASEPKLCRHLHIPLQSGDSGVLAGMNRPYDQAFYLDRCRAAYARIPDLAITSDIMVGFPGEDRAAFESTLHVVRTVGYARAHLFRYSPRPNTPAADRRIRCRMPRKRRAARNSPRPAGKRRRALSSAISDGTRSAGRRQREAGDATQTRRQSGNDGHERIGGAHASGAFGLLGGYTSNYIRVQFTGGSHLIGTIASARLLEPTRGRRDRGSRRRAFRSDGSASGRRILASRDLHRAF